MKKGTLYFFSGVGALLIVVAAGWWIHVISLRHQEAKEEGKNMFHSVLFESIPPGVEDIETVGNFDVNNGIFLRFHAPSDFSAQLLSLRDYKTVRCADESFQKEAEPLFRTLKKEKIQPTECYTTFLFNESGIQGKLYKSNVYSAAKSGFIVDTENTMIYFFEKGIQKDEPQS